MVGNCPASTAPLSHRPPGPLATPAHTFERRGIKAVPPRHLQHPPQRDIRERASVAAANVAVAPGEPHLKRPVAQKSDGEVPPPFVDPHRMVRCLDAVGEAPQVQQRARGDHAVEQPQEPDLDRDVVGIQGLGHVVLDELHLALPLLGNLLEHLETG